MARRAPSPMGRGMGDAMARRARPTGKVVWLRSRQALGAGDEVHIDAPQTRALARQTRTDPKLRRIGGFWQVGRDGRLFSTGT